MNLREQLLREHSKTNCDRIVQWTGNNQQRFDELFDLFLHDEYRVVQRAAWALSFAVINHPELIRKHMTSLIRNLQQPAIPDAVKRNTLRLLQFVKIPKKLQGEIIDTCFRYITTPAEAAAIKAFSLTILDNLSQDYPEIKNELKLVIEEQWDHGTAAFRSRAKKILKKPD